ncbi:MAG: DUF2141 domain-containing protein [Verrucomicrobiota bacterium]
MRFALIVTMILVAGGFVFAKETGTGTVVVDVSGIKEVKGRVVVSFFSSEKDFLKIPVKQVAVPVTKAGEVTVRCEGVPAGVYGVTVHQDFDGNNEIEKNALGIPKEPYGFGNNAKGRMGPPSFEKASITVKSGGELDTAVALTGG